MTTNSNLILLRKLAEEAVADMPEGNLKNTAFGIILQHLLSSETTSIVTQSQKKGSHKKHQSREKSDSSRTPGSAKSRILLLKDEGFFANLKGISEVEEELKAHGWIHPQTSLSGPMQSLVQDRHLRRVKDKQGQKKIWKYVNP